MNLVRVSEMTTVRLVKMFGFVAVALLLMFPGSIAYAAKSSCSPSHTCLQDADLSAVRNKPLRLAQAPATTQTRPKVLIRQPKEEIPRKAFKALEKHCARCHQYGRLERDMPAKDFGNILQLDEIARDPHLIRPGNPDGSPLFSRIVKQEMPYDVYTEFSGGTEPSKEDVQAIYDWIESLDAKKVAACDNRKPIDTAQLVNTISTDLNRQAASRRKGMRYLTLTANYNTCASNTALTRMRNGASLLLNSLSRASKIERTSAIGPSGTIIAFNLDDLGWSQEDWDTLAAAYPYGARPRSQAFETIKSRTGAALPYLRADWFAAAASRPPLYYKLLDLPEKRADLVSELGIDAQANIDEGKVIRAGFDRSVIARNNRIVERHKLRNGSLWMSYDFDGTGAEQKIKNRPLGPDGEDAFAHDLNALIFSLPNGMNAFYLADEEGKRLDAAPPDILFDDTHPRQPVITGLSCMSCHVKGVRGASDEVRENMRVMGQFSATERDRVMEIYVPEDELDSNVREDRNRYARAAAKGGLRLVRGNDGLDDLSFLVRSYEKNLDLRTAAAEYGVTQSRYSSGMAKAGKDAQRTKQELEQGGMPRRKFEPLFLKTIAAVSADVPVGRIKAPDSRPAKPPLATTQKTKPKVTEKPKKPAPVVKDKPKVVKDKPKKETKTAAVTPDKPAVSEKEETITLVSNKVRYRANDLPVFTVNASTDCSLTLINVGPTGRATVIFPNKYQQDNEIKGGKDFQFPGPDAPFQFRLKDIGKEKLIAECTSGSGNGRIEHQFEQQEFTDLGDYRDHVGEQAEKEGEKKTASNAKTRILRTAITFTVK